MRLAPGNYEGPGPYNRESFKNDMWVEHLSVTVTPVPSRGYLGKIHP